MGDQRLVLPATEAVTVTGSVEGQPLTNASVVVRFPDEQSARVVRNDSVDAEGDRWFATLDLSAVEEGWSFVAWLQQDGHVIDAVAGDVGPRTASVTFQNQTTSGADSAVIVQRAFLPSGGFVALHDDSPSGEIVEVSNYLEPGRHENVTIQLEEAQTGPATLVAMPHRDDDCNERWGFPTGLADDPYEDHGTPSMPVTDSATVQFSTLTPSPSPTATRTPSPTSTLTESNSRSASLEETGVTGTGFGITASSLPLLVGWSCCGESDDRADIRTDSRDTEYRTGGSDGELMGRRPTVEMGCRRSPSST